jgi:hypothetical protein
MIIFIAIFNNKRREGEGEKTYPLTSKQLRGLFSSRQSGETDVKAEYQGL